MHPLEDFLRGPLRKLMIEVQERTAFQSLFETYHPDFHAETMRSMEWDEHLCWLRAKGCLQTPDLLTWFLNREDNVTKKCV